MYGGLDTWQRLTDATRPSLNLVEAGDEAHHSPSVVLRYPVRAPVFSKEAEVMQKPALSYNRPRFGAWSRFAPADVDVMRVNGRDEDYTG
jgi:hypothetical protein